MSGLYIGAIAELLGIPEASTEELEEAAITQIVDAGYSVFQDKQGYNFRVRVQKRNRGGKVSETRFLYNETTVSTSSMPILRAWDKWREATKAGVA